MKLTKKIVCSLITVLVLVFALSFVKVSATNTLVLEDGACVRETGDKAGLKFVAHHADCGEVEHGFYLYFGTTDAAGMAAKIAAHDEDVHKVSVSGYNDENGEFTVTIWNISDVLLGQEFTAIAYYDGELSSNVVTRNVADVVREAAGDKDYVNGDYTEATLPKVRVKVTTAAGGVGYYTDTNDANYTMASGDTIELASGSYTNALTIECSDITIKGNYASKLGTSSNRAAANESVMTQVLTIGNGVDRVVINGLKFTGTNAIKLLGSQANVEIKYNVMNCTGTAGITDDKGSETYNDIEHRSISIVKNKIVGKNNTENRNIYLQGYVRNINIQENYIGSDLEAIAANEYCIKMNRICADSLVNIYKNDFRDYGANYLIDCGFSHNAENFNTAHYNIEDNSMSSSYSKCLQGNGIRVSWLGTGAVVNIIHNNQFRTSGWYNAILLCDASSSAKSSNSQKPTVNIKYNMFYTGKEEEATNANRTSEYGRCSRVGLGIAADATVNVEYNYIGSSCSNSAFATNSSGISYSSTNETAMSTNKAESESAGAVENRASTRYATYKSSIDSFLDDLEEYKEAVKSLTNNVYASYYGEDEYDITVYIPEFDVDYANKFGIDHGMLVYYGDDTVEAAYSYINGVAAIYMPS